MYAVIDIETTGGSAKYEKITEIAIYKHDGKQIVDEFVSLVNPERLIPPFITQLTGITNEMVRKAPKFYEIAKRVVEITEGCVFVAHNVGFDYGFVREEFKSLGFDYFRNKLCTVRMSRRLLPGHRSYSLGKLTKELGISLNGHHRAAADARATVTLFELLLQKEQEQIVAKDKQKLEKAEGLHRNFDKQQALSLPKVPGTYYFYDEDDKLIYIGKSKNIRSRVLSHLSNNSGKKAVEMKGRILRIGHESCGNELVALLKESHDIKQHQPIYNRRQKSSRYNYGLAAYYDQLGYIRLNVVKDSREQHSVTAFSSMGEAKATVTRLIKQYALCQKLCGLYNTPGSCFAYRIKECKGACLKDESPKQYNARVKMALDSLRFIHSNVLLVDKGRKKGEKSIVLIQNKKYLGYGFVPASMLNTNVEDLKQAVTIFPDNRDIQYILKRYLGTYKPERIISFSYSGEDAIIIPQKKEIKLEQQRIW